MCQITDTRTSNKTIKYEKNPYLQLKNIPIKGAKFREKVLKVTDKHGLNSKTETYFINIFPENLPGKRKLCEGLEMLRETYRSTEKYSLQSLLNKMIFQK